MEIIGRQASPVTYPPEFYEYSIVSKLLSIQCTLMGIAIVSVLLRSYVRIVMLHTFGKDDWFVVIAMLLSIGGSVCFIIATTLGLGKHFAVMPPANWEKFFRVMYVYAILVVLSVSFIKISIGFFLLRLAQRPLHRRFIYGTMVFIALATIGAVLSLVFQCIPVDAAWDFSKRPPAGSGKCYSIKIYRSVGVLNSSINIVTDVLYAVLPIPLVWTLQVNFRTKLSLVIILGLGFFACIAAIVKTPMQYRFFDEPDPTGTGAYYYIWQIVEMDVGIIATCLSTLKPLFKSVLETARSVSGTSRGQNLYKRSSLGYVKQPDSIALSNLSSRANPDPEPVYNVKCSTGKTDAYHTSKKEEAGITFGKDSDRMSDDSILPLQTPQASSPERDNRGIMRTTEVTIQSDTAISKH